MNRLFGLIGYPLAHSWSKKYFERKFRDEAIHGASYELFPVRKTEEIMDLVHIHTNLAGLNVTIPYKTSVIPFLSKLDGIVSEINAVNTIRIERDGENVIMTGHNTDAWGFENSLKPLLRPHHRAAMILGTGGAAKAAAWVLDKLGIDHVFISRNPGRDQLAYHELSEDIFEKFTLIINATPVGMYPDVSSCHPIPYHCISAHHLLYDMVYNPQETAFMARGKQQGAVVKGGLEMLHLQAEKSWEIWNL